MRAPFTAPRLRWSAPGILRLGKSAEAAIDFLEQLGGFATVEDLAELLHVSRVRDFRRRVIGLLEERGIVTVTGENVALVEDWLEALNREREASGEIAAYKRDMERFNREREGYANRDKHAPDDAPTPAELDAGRQDRQENRYAAALEAFRAEGSGARRNLALFMDGELQNLEYLVNSVLAFHQVPRAAWETQREWWREPVLRAGSVVARAPEPASEPGPEESEEWKSHPLDCACEDCLYPTPTYARSYDAGSGVAV